METPRKTLADIKPVGGHPALDFVNTVHSRVHERGDYLETAEDMVNAQVMTGLVPAQVARQVLSACRAHPEQARALLARGMELRETLYRILVAHARARAPAAADMERFNTMLAEQRPRQRLRVKGGGFRWDWELDPARPDSILAPVTEAAAALLTSDRAGRIKECPGPDGCGWLFLDTSRNRSRHWCSMSDCGNVAKVRRHRRRLQQGAR